MSELRSETEEREFLANLLIWILCSFFFFPLTFLVRMVFLSQFTSIQDPAP